MEQQEQQQQRGLCGLSPGRSTCCGSGVSAGPPDMRLSITSTTGHPVELTVPRGETVEGLRTHISHRLRMQTDRIVLLHKDRQLTAGKLLDLGVTDGSKLTLVPVVEAGLACSTARAERSMMDVLGSLTEAQISSFLSGHSPLTLNLGIGAHVMYVQLQLSAQHVAELQQQQQQQQQQRDFKAGSRSEIQTGTSAAARMNLPDSAAALSSAGSTASPVSKTPTAALDLSPTRVQLNRARARTSFNSTAPASHLLSSTPSPPHHACPPLSFQKSSPVTSPSLPHECPHPSSPLQAAAPSCSPAAMGSDPGPPSPTPASTVRESHGLSSPAAEPCQPPGAVIESFVSHSPGVFSGTFSGTLAPCSQSSTSHPHGGISIILQILHDLLRAAFHHQGASPAAPHLHRTASIPPVSPLIPVEEQRDGKSKALETQRTECLSKTPDEDIHPLQSATQENQALHCKLERLQFLMQQRRTRRRTRRNSHLSKTSNPYQHSRHRP